MQCSNEHRLFDHLVGAGEQTGGQIEPERLGGLQVDDQLQPCGLLYGKVARLFTLQYAVNIGCGLPNQDLNIGAVLHEAALLDKFTPPIQHWQPV